MSYFRCNKCRGFFHESDVETNWVSGRVGHPDNWLPDEVTSHCPHCGADIDYSEEHDEGMLIELIEGLEACFKLNNPELTYTKLQEFLRGN